MPRRSGGASGSRFYKSNRTKVTFWLIDKSCVRLRPEHRNHVWSSDFVQDRTHDGRVFRTHNVIDEFTSEDIVIRVKGRRSFTDVVYALTDLFILRSPLKSTRPDTGTEIIPEKVCAWIAPVGAKTALIEPGSSRRNDYCESFNARFRDELLNSEVFHFLRKALT